MALDDRRTLRLRHLGPADEGELRRLYAGLSPADLRRRFFSGGRPPEDFIRRWTTLDQAGGLGLAAELIEGDRIHLIGEAGYALTGDGDGELGIAVASSHRGWIGPWLLDSLLSHAKANGIPNLQAVVLTDNRPMMALARKRGYAILGHLDWGKAQITMSTDGHQPAWPAGRDRPRVLIETDRTRWRAEDELRAAGFDVALCPGLCGPETAVDRCPVLAGSPCPLVEGADAVIVDFLSNPTIGRRLVDAEQLVHPGVRLVETYDIDDDGEPRRRSAGEILDSLADLLETSHPPPP